MQHPRPERKYVNSWDRLGIEVELEGVLGMDTDEDEIHQPDSPWWCKGDGSLRGAYAYEFVLKNPTPLSDVESAVQMLGEYDPVISAAATRRCSTHIHLDCRGQTAQHKARRIVGSLILEPMLYAMVDPARAQSVFCRPSWSQGRGTYRDIGRAIAAGYLVDDFAERQSKYTGINFHALCPYGSIEYRMAPAIKNPDALLHWVDVLLSVRRFSNDLDLSAEGLLAVSYKYRQVVEEHLGWAFEYFAVTEDEIRRSAERVSYVVKNICMEY